MTRSWTSKLSHALALSSILAVGLLTYGFTLRLPLFLDDMVHFRWLQWQTVDGILWSSRGLGYYRPLPFLIWKLLWSLQGTLHPPTLHAVNLGVHLLNGLLVWSVVRGQQWPRAATLGWACALLFLVYPFSYQAVPWVGSFTHPLVTLLILASLWLYQLGERHARPAWRAGSVGLAFLAPFAHETGVLLPTLLVLLLLTRQDGLTVKQAVWRTRFHWLGACAGLLVWLAVPKSLGQPQVWNLEARYQNGVYLLQGLAYPVAPLARNVTATGWGLDDLQSILFVSLPALFLWTLFLWRAKAGRPLALALGWFAVAVAPVWLMLGFEYIVDGPRLLYNSAIGVSLLWASPLAIPWPAGRLQKTARLLSALAVLLVGLSGYWFVGQRAALYEQLRQTVRQFVQAIDAIDAPGEVLCVNCPLWLAPQRPTFAVGHEGVPLLYASYQLSDLLWANTGEEREMAGVVIPDIQRPWRYHYVGTGDVQSIEGLQGPLRQAAGVILTDYEQETIAIYPVGALETQGAAPQTPFLADFDRRLRLLSAETEREDAVLRVTLRWQSLQTLAENTTVFVHLVDSSGQLVGQRDGYPLMGLASPQAWQPGDVWRDVRVLHLPEGVVGTVTLNVGLYTVTDGLRLPAVGPQGQSFLDDAVPVASLASIHTGSQSK